MERIPDSIDKAFEFWYTFTSFMKNPPEQSESFHTRTRVVARNSLFLFGFQIFTKLLLLASAIILANYYGTALYGIFSYGFAFAALFLPLADFGMEMFFLKEISRSDSPHPADTTAFLFAGKSALALAIGALLAVVAGFSDSFLTMPWMVVVAAGFTTFIRGVGQSLAISFRGVNRTDREALLLSAGRTLDFLVIVAVVAAEGSLLMLLHLLALSALVSTAFTYLAVRRLFVVPQFTRLIETGRSMIKGSLPFALTMLMTNIYFNADTIMVAKFIGIEAAGIYRAAYNLIMPMMMISAAVAGAVFPYVSRHYEHEWETVVPVLKKSILVLLSIGIPLAIFVSASSSEIIALLYKKEFSPASSALQILIWFVPVVYMTNLFGLTLGAMNRQRSVMIIGIANAGFNIVSNLFLIPRMGFIGASFTTVGTELLGLTLLYLQMHRHMDSIFSLRDMARICAASLLALPVFLVPLPVPVLVKFAIAGVCYLIILFAIGGIRKADIRFLLNK
jgi:O-antigen/teichoic acid export membrane protein